jgi:hypothetical protein
MKPSPKQKKSQKEKYIIELSKSEITNRIFTLNIQYKVEELIFADMLGPKKVRLDILKDQKRIGQAVASEYGFDEATNEIVLQHLLSLTVPIWFKQCLIAILYYC